GAFLGLSLPAAPGEGREQAERAGAAPPRPPARLHLVVPGGRDAPPLPPTVTALIDTEGALAATYGAARGTLWAIRPDGHLAPRARGATSFGELVERAAGWHLPAARAA